MGKALSRIAVLLFVVLAVASLASADVPHLIDFQGRLTDSSGPLSGTKSMVFEFRDAPTGGSLLGTFSETQSVTVTDGIFNAAIGSATPGGIPSAIFDNPAVCLSVEVAGEELLPRQRVVAVAYALRAEKADEADHATTADSADTALTADYATAAGVAQLALKADHAKSADSADTALTADHATTAGAAQSAQNADLLDMLDSTAFAAADHTHPGGDITAGEILTALLTVDGAGSGLDADLLDGKISSDYATAGHGHALVDIAGPKDLLAAIKTIDGAGSGLDADLLDGQHGSYYRSATNLNAGTVNAARFSAYLDLSIEGHLNNSSDSDLLTRTQADGRYVNVTGDTMTGALDVDADLSCSNLTVDYDATVNRVLYVTPEDGVGGIICGNVEQPVYNLDIGTEGSLRADDSLYVGSSSHSGNIYVKNTAGTTTFQVSGSTGNVTADGDVTVGDDVTVGSDLTVDWDATIDRVLYVTPEDGIGAIICGTVEQPTYNLDIATEGNLKADDALYVGSANHSGDVYVKNTAGTTTFQVSGSSGNTYVKNTAGTTTFQVTGSSGDITTTGDVNFSAGDGIDLLTNNGSLWQLYGSNTTGSSQLRLSGPSSGEFLLDWNYATIKLGGTTNDTVRIPAIIKGDRAGYGAMDAAVIAEHEGGTGIAMYGYVTSSDACAVFANSGTGEIIKGFSSGAPVFTVRNSGRVVCTALQITGGGDLAEPFDFANAEAVKPGMVVAIDPDNPGKLRLAAKAYDRTVAGVISGANGVQPGVTMQQEGTAADGSLPVALTGRVYCWCDAANGAIGPGDMLTTSDTPGHAMKVTDYDRSRGATIGKAMTSLKEGRGFVLMLVMPQ